MQATGYHLSGSVSLSTHVKGKPRKHPVWVLRYRLPSGKQSDKVLGRAWLQRSRPPAGYLTRAQAEALKQRFLDENAETVPEDRKTFGRACKDFLEFAEVELHRAGTTLHEYRRLAEGLCARPWRQELTWADRPLDTFTEEELRALRKQLRDEGKSSSTLNQTRRVLRGAFGKRSVVAAFEWMPVRRHVSQGKIQFYEPQQVSLLKQCAAHDLDRAIFTLATEAGPRKSEILGLKISDVDFNSGLLRFRDGFTEKGGHAGTKGKRVRSVPMSDNVRAALEPLCLGRPAMNEDGSPTLVFESDGGRPIAGSALYRRFKAAARKARLPEITFHELRHTFGTQMIAVVDIFTLQQWMGHRDITTTQIYLHYRPNPEHGAMISSAFEHDRPADVIPIRAAS